MTAPNDADPAVGPSNRSIFLRSAIGVLASFVAFALAILGVQAVVDTATGFQVADPRENNCEECTFNGYAIVKGDVGPERRALDLGPSTRWRIDAVAPARFSDTGADGERSEVTECYRFGSGPAQVTVDIPGGYTTATIDCRGPQGERRDAVVFWKFAALDWTGVKITQPFRGGPVIETPIRGTYFYKADVYLVDQ